MNPMQPLSFTKPLPYYQRIVLPMDKTYGDVRFSFFVRRLWLVVPSPLDETQLWAALKAPGYPMACYNMGDLILPPGRDGRAAALAHLAECVAHGYSFEGHAEHYRASSVVGRLWLPRTSLPNEALWGVW